MSDIFLMLILFGTLIFIVIFVFLLKILAMISLFGWEKTKELLKSDNWEFGRNIPEKLKRISEEDIHGSK